MSEFRPCKPEYSAAATRHLAPTGRRPQPGLRLVFAVFRPRGARLRSRGEAVRRLRQCLYAPCVSRGVQLARPAAPETRAARTSNLTLFASDGMTEADSDSSLGAGHPGSESGPPARRPRGASAGAKRSRHTRPPPPPELKRCFNPSTTAPSRSAPQVAAARRRANLPSPGP